MTDYEQMTSRTKYPGRGYTWGEYVKTHTIANFQIVEYIDNEGVRMFHPYIDGKDTCESFATLKRAVVGAIAYESEGPNSYADSYFFKMIAEETE